MKVTTMYITPEIAKSILSRNTKNRRVNQQRVNQYANDMVNGRWYENGESIVITENGELRDGQHRLEACVKSGKSFMFAVSIVPDENAVAYDSGQGRSASQIIKLTCKDLRTISLNTRIHGAIKYIMLRKINNEDMRKSVSPVELSQFADENADLFSEFQYQLNNLGANMKYFRIVPVVAAEISALHCGYDIEKLKYFVDVLGSGFCSSENDYPIIALRNYLIKSHNNVGYSFYDEKYNKTIQALHLFEVGSKTKTLVQAKKDWYPWK